MAEEVMFICAEGVKPPKPSEVGPWVFCVGSSKIQIHCSYGAAKEIALGDAIDRNIDTVLFLGRLRL